MPARPPPPKIRRPPVIKEWFGFQSETESSESEYGTWTEVDGKKKKEDKRRRLRRKRRELETLMATKAGNIIGIGPVDRNLMEEQRKKGINFERSKILAVREVLQRELRYENNELDELTIRETKHSTKGEDLIYVALAANDQIKEMHIRAELMNDNVIIQNYILPNFYERFAHLNRVCQEKRSLDKSLKNQLRFGKRDIEIYIKYKGEGIPFRQVKMEAFTDINEVPLFDHDKVVYFEDVKVD